jgi:hypothetical protein
MTDHPKKPPETAKLIVLEDRISRRISHRVEKPWRKFKSFRKEQQFEEHLTSLAGLPSGDRLVTILEIAERNQLPEIARRATPSPLENEFLALIAALISSPEKNWVQLLRDFLADHGWKAELRGSPPKHPLELTDRRRGEKIDEIVPRLKKGFDLKSKEKRKRGYSSSSEVIGPKLHNLGYDDQEIEAILRRRELHSAACYVYRSKHEPQVTPKTILNSYERFSKTKVKKHVDG